MIDPPPTCLSWPPIFFLLPSLKDWLLGGIGAKHPQIIGIREGSESPIRYLQAPESFDLATIKAIAEIESGLYDFYHEGGCVVATALFHRLFHQALSSIRARLPRF